MWNQIVEQTLNSITELYQQRIKRILKKKLKLHYLKHLKINNLFHISALLLQFFDNYAKKMHLFKFTVPVLLVYCKT